MVDETLYEKAVALVRKHDRAAVGWLGIELKVGYRKAVALRDAMEYRGVLKKTSKGKVEVVK